MFKILYNNKRGMAVLPAMVILALVIMVVALALTGRVFRESKMSVTSSESQESFYLSESGVQDALLKAARDKNATSSGYSPNITEENLNVAISGTTTKIIEASSSVKDKNKNIKVIIEVNNDGEITSYSWEEK